MKNKLFIFGLVFLFMISFVSATDYIYDDFSGASLNSTLWDSYELGTVSKTQTGGYLQLNGTGVMGVSIFSKTKIPKTTPFILTSRVYLYESNGNYVKYQGIALSDVANGFASDYYATPKHSAYPIMLKLTTPEYSQPYDIENGYTVTDWYSFTNQITYTSKLTLGNWYIVSITSYGNKTLYSCFNSDCVTTQIPDTTWDAWTNNISVIMHEASANAINESMRIDYINVTSISTPLTNFELTLNNPYNNTQINNFTALFSQPSYPTIYTPTTIFSNSVENQTRKEDSVYSHKELSDEWKNKTALYMTADVNATNNIVYDWSENKNNGTVTGAVWNETMKAFDFDGINDYISTSSIYNDFIFICLKEYNYYSNAQPLFSQLGYISLARYANYRYKFYTTNASDAIWSGLTSTSNITDVCISFRNSTKNASLYVNGILDTNKIITTTSDNINFTNSFFISRIGTSYLNGSISKPIVLSSIPSGYTEDSLAFCLHYDNCTGMFKEDGTQKLINTKVNASIVDINFTDMYSKNPENIQYRLTNGTYFTSWYNYLTNNTINLGNYYTDLYLEMKLSSNTSSTPIFIPKSLNVTTNALYVQNSLNLTINETYNMSFYAPGYILKTEYFVFNESKVFNMSSHELISPLNNAVINNSRIVNFTYQIVSELGNCSLYLNESYMQSQSPVLGYNNFTHIFSGNGPIYWTVKCDGAYPNTQQFDFEESVYRPLFINYSPSNLSFSTNEGSSISFSSDVDSPLDYSLGWYLDNILQSINNVWTWIIDFFSAGEHTVELRVNDSFGQNSTLTYNVTVLNVNLAPTIDSISITPSYFAPNLNTTIYCVSHDDSNLTSTLDVEIEIRDGLFWTPLTVYYSSGNTSYSIIPSGTYESGDVVDVRCRATDIDDVPLTSEWFTINSAITFNLDETAPEAPRTLEPKFGTYKFIIPVMCSDSVDLESERQRMSYELDVSLNESNYTMISNSSGFVAYSYNIYEDAYNTSYQFRCRGYDGLEYSNYSYTAQIYKKNIPVFQLVELTEERTLMAGKPRQFTVYVDLSSLSGYKVIYSYIDCDSNGIWDGYTDHNSENIDKVDDTYSCVFLEGLNEMKYGVVIEKTVDLWSGICDSLDGSVDKCDYSKTARVLAR